MTLRSRSASSGSGRPVRIRAGWPAAWAQRPAPDRQEAIGRLGVVDAIVADGLEKRYQDVHALAGVSLTVRAGEVFGLLGPNGAGKSTTVKVLTTLTIPDRGP